MGMVFISYNRSSLDVVKGLAQDLVAASCQPWFDQELTGGQRWWDSILARIRDCDAFVFALTPDSLDSQACGREFDYAVALGKPVLPVLLSDQVDTRNLRAAIGEIHYVDYRRQDKHAAFSLMRALAALPAAPALPDPLPNPPAVPISYVVSLRERIDNASPLDYQDQIALVIELRDRYREGRPVEEITALLDRLKRRDDLLAKVAREIDAVIAEIAQGRAAASATTGPAPSSTSAQAPPSPSSPQRNRSARKEAADVAEPLKAPVAESVKASATEPADATVPMQVRKSGEAQGQDNARSKAVERIRSHLRLDDNAPEECERVMRRVVARDEHWVFEIDSQNCFTLALDTSETRSITAIGSLRDRVLSPRSEQLKELGWTLKEHSFAKGATGAAAVYATGGVAALALLSKTVRDLFMSFEATHSWPVSGEKASLAGPAAEFALALQRVAQGVETILVRKKEDE